MSKTGRILVADDEETFLLSTANLLRREGFTCDCAPDAAAARDLLGRNHYDLLITDVKMPGNGRLEFIRSLSRTVSALPVILVTGYPSLDTAIESIRLPVVSYLFKPVDFDELLGQVRLGMKYSTTYQAVDAASKRLSDWNRDLGELEQLMRAAYADAAPVSTSTFLNLMMSNMVGALSDLTNLTEGISAREGNRAACHLLNCPRPATLVEGLTGAIAVLEKTKRAFKSKELGDLRQKLQEHLRQVGEA